MATNTTNYNLVKPANGDYYDISVQNGNMDIIDARMKANADAIAEKQVTITGGASSIVTNDLALNRVLISNGSGKVAVSDITTTILNYLAGLTGSVQAQINGKENVMSKVGTSADNYGSIKTNEGLKIQWRSQQLSANAGTITFPEAFTTTNYVVLASIQATTGTNFTVMIRTKRTESIDIYTNWTSGGTTVINAIAMGW